MISTFLNSLKNSIEQRKQIVLPQQHGLVLLIVICVSLYLIIAFQRPPIESKDYHFENEAGAITALSAIFLAMAGGFAGFSFILLKKNKNFLSFFWLLATAVLVFFSLDELLGFHEKVAIWIRHSSLGPPQTFRNWNDVIVIGYGFIALFVFISFLPAILRYPRFLEMLLLAFGFYFIHTFIDSTSERTMVSTILEESAKLFCSAFLMLSMLIGLLGVVFTLDKKKSYND